MALPLRCCAVRITLLSATTDEGCPPAFELLLVLFALSSFTRFASLALLRSTERSSARRSLPVFELDSPDTLDVPLVLPLAGLVDPDASPLAELLVFGLALTWFALLVVCVLLLLAVFWPARPYARQYFLLLTILLLYLLFPTKFLIYDVKLLSVPIANYSTYR